MIMVYENDFFKINSKVECPYYIGGHFDQWFWVHLKSKIMIMVYEHDFFFFLSQIDSNGECTWWHSEHQLQYILHWHDDVIKWKHFCRVTGHLGVGNSPVTGEFPAQRPVTWSFGVFFYLPLNKCLSKQPRRWWFEMPSRTLWRHCNGYD